MLFLPYERYEITSAATPEEIMTRLNTDTETNPPLFPFFYNGGKSFKGKIERDHFAISRINRGRNRFLPKIKGSVTEHGTGSKITIEISDQSIIYGLVLWILLVSLPLGKFQQKISVQTAGSVLVIFYLLIIVFFNVEVNRAKELLEKVVK